MAVRFSSAPALSFALVAAACAPDVPTGDAVANQALLADSRPAAPADVQVPAADAKLVVAFGDSLFAGYRLENGAGFAPVLERQLAAQGLKASVHNAAVSGDTTQAGRQRLAFAIDGLSRKPDLVIVGLGGNDMLRGLRPEDTRANLDAILTELRRREIPAMLTGMIAAPNLGRDYAAAFNAIYPELAEKYDVPLYPFILDGVVGQRRLMLDDGIHPNPAGVTAMVERVAPIVSQALESAPAS